jgi:hypothetical protein
MDMDKTSTERENNLERMDNKQLKIATRIWSLRKIDED